jgi:hypothetical protein
MKKKLLAGALVALGVITFAGCSSDDDGSSSTTTPSEGKAGVCEARDQLQDGISDLADPTLLTSGKSGVQSALNEVQDDLDNLKEAAKTDYDSEVEDLQTSIDGLKDAVSNLGEGSITESISDLGTAVSNVADSAQPLLDKLRADCP